jgi:hypothetical protein
LLLIGSLAMHYVLDGHPQLRPRLVALMPVSQGADVKTRVEAGQVLSKGWINALASFEASLREAPRDEDCPLMPS